MATVTPTVEAADARVRLFMDLLTSVPTADDTFTVTRHHPSGRIADVRSLVDVPIVGAQALGYDYELPIGVACTYRVTTKSGAVTSVGPLSAPVVWETTGAWLKDLSRPDLSMKINVVELDTLDWPQPQGVFTILGRRTPVVVADIRNSARGTLTLATLTMEDYDRLLTLTSFGQPLLFQAHTDFGIGAMYVAVGNVRERRLGRADWPTRTWDLAFVEVDPPSGGVVGSDQTYQMVLTAYPASYTAVMNGEPTYLTLLEEVGTGGGTAVPIPPLPLRGQ